MGKISAKAIAKVSGPAWDSLRPQFNAITESLLAVAPNVFAELTTIYIKFTLNESPSSPVYAVVWVKNTKCIVVGLALPDGVGELLPSAPKGMSYKGLTRYLTVAPQMLVPLEFADWAVLAYETIKQTQPDNI